MVDLLVNEIFLSIQGESTHAGKPCAFIRLTGCPLDCAWCDTGYAKTEGRKISIKEITAQIKDMGVDMVEVTGGEPLAQEGAIRLIRELCDHGWTVLLETSGAMDITDVDTRAHIIMDVKCPASGMESRMRWQNLWLLKAGDEVKFVIADRGDYEYARRLVKESRWSPETTVLFSTVLGSLEPRQLVEWILEDKLKVRFQLQMHKYIWPVDARGV